jgi:hypothetical protein
LPSPVRHAPVPKGSRTPEARFPRISALVNVVNIEVALQDLEWVEEASSSKALR